MQVLARCSKWQCNCVAGFVAPDQDKLLSNFHSLGFSFLDKGHGFSFVLKRVLVHASGSLRY
jgi:hypothetical protein